MLYLVKSSLYISTVIIVHLNIIWKEGGGEQGEIANAYSVVNIDIHISNKTVRPWTIRGYLILYYLIFSFIDKNL